MANLFWVGALPASWDGTALLKWSATSGGVGGLAIPTSADNAFVDANSGSGTLTLASGNTGCLNLDFTGFTGTFAGSAAITISGGLTAASGMTWSNTSTLTFGATSGTNVITSAGKTFNNSLTLNGVGGIWQFADDHSNNSAKTITLTNGTVDINGKTVTVGIFSSNNSNTRTIAFGTGNVTLTGSGTTIWTTGGVTGLTITGTPVVNCTYSGSTGSRTINTGTISEANSVSFNVSAGSDTFVTSPSVNQALKNLDFTGFSGAYTPTGIPTVYGNLTCSATMSVTSSTNTITLGATSGTKAITSNGAVFNCPLEFDGVGGTWQFADDLTVGSSRSVTLTNGTLDGNGKNVSLPSFGLHAGTKTLTLGSGTWTVTDSGSAWNALTNGTGLTVSASVGIISMTSASAKTFAGNGKAWPTLNQGGAGTLTVTGSNTFNDMTNTVAGIVSLTSSTTTTVTAFHLGSTTFNAVTPGTFAALVCASGTINVSSLTIKDSHASGGARFQSYTTNGNVDNGGNTGWIFTEPTYRHMLRYS